MTALTQPNQTPEAAGPGVEPFTADWFRSLFAEPLWNVPHWQRDVLMAVSALTQPQPEAKGPVAAGVEAIAEAILRGQGHSDEAIETLREAGSSCFWHSALRSAEEVFALTQPNQTPEAAAPSGSVGEDDRPLILEACEPLPSVPTDYVLTCRWPDGSETVECVSEQAAALLGYRGQWIDGTLAAQQPAPQAPVADAAGLESLRAAIYGQPDTPKEITPLSWLRSMLDACDTQEAVQSLGGDDPDAWGEMCGEVRRMVDALDRAALTPPQAARPGDGVILPSDVREALKAVADARKAYQQEGAPWSTLAAARARFDIISHAWFEKQLAPVQADAAEGRS